MLNNELDMSFNYEPIPYGKIKSGVGEQLNKDTQGYKMLCLATHNDLKIGDIFLRLGQKEKCFNTKIAWEENVLQTMTANLEYYRGTEKERISKEDVIHSQTFPEDYDFCGDSRKNVEYVCGMSVPPVMIKRIVLKLIEQGIYN